MQLDILEYILAFFAAFFGGFIDAIIGGGGLITLPVILAIGLNPTLAIATSKLQASMGALSALFALRKQIQFKKLNLGILCSAIFAALGSFTVLKIDSSILKPIVISLLVLVFIYTILKPDLGQYNKQAKMKMSVFLLIFASILGFYDGFIGPGTGSFYIFAFVSIMGCNIKEASINTKALNATSNIVSLIFFAFFYEILIKLGLIMGIGGILGAYVGAKMLLKVNINIVKKLFYLIVFATIIKLIFF